MKPNCVGSDVLSVPDATYRRSAPRELQGRFQQLSTG